jgi:uncharacterized RDD family membrane protein YckC
MRCPNCGQENTERAIYCQSCGRPLHHSVETNAGSPKQSYAGFWERLAAVIIDAVIVTVGVGIIGAMTFGTAIPPLALFGPWIYEAWMLSSPWQATLGKRALSITVTGVNGGRISFARATGRHFAKYLSAFLLGIGFLMAAFTARKQALHDILAETLVNGKNGNLP